MQEQLYSLLIEIAQANLQGQTEGNKEYISVNQLVLTKLFVQANYAL